MFTKLRFIAAYCALVALLIAPHVAAAAQPGKRPNILFILVDDQSPFDFKFYNPKSSLQTPIIDRLAAEGMVLDAAYHMGAFNGAVCTPSRHMIMTGRTVWHLPIGPGAKDHCPPGVVTNTLAAVFNRAGYATMRTCKVGNSYDGANKLFTVRHDAVKRGGSDQSGSAWHAEQVLNYLGEREASKDAKPFLIYFGFSHPHDTRDGKPELLAKYGAVNHTDKATLPPANPKQPALPANYLPAHPFHHGHPNLRDEVAVSGVWTNRDERTIRNELGREFACSENIDTQIGRVLNKLKAMGELENTYIIYTADHGMAIGRHGLQGKQNLYEHTWRVPFVAKGPGIKPGSRAPANIYLLDLLATFCDLTGVTPPESNEGLSFKPVLLGQRQTVREVMFGAYSGGTKPGMRCVRQGDWKLIKYDVLGGKVRETQLFNLAENPEEFLQEHHDPNVIALTGITPTSQQINLAKDPKYRAKLAEMEAVLLAEMRRLDDPSRLWNQPADGLKALPAAEGNGSWNQFRGPRGTGVAEEFRPPVKLAAGNLIWKRPVPPGLSSPVLSRNRIFLTAVEGDHLVTLALDAVSGNRVWTQQAPALPKEKVHEANSPATPTPFVDNERVHVYFGSYGLLCYDLDGREQWRKPIATPKSLYGMATSPIGHGENLILVLDNEANLEGSKLSQSKILALKKSTGETVWETPRPFQRSGWSTPTIWKHAGGEDLVVLGSGRLCGYDPRTGAEKWFTTGFSRETIAMPVSDPERLYASASMLGGMADEKPDPEPFWKAMLHFDANGDGKIARGEMTRDFTFPLRPELPAGHPGFGLPLPDDEMKRKSRQNDLFRGVDKNQDGFWTHDEFIANLSFRRGKPMLVAIRPGGRGDVTDTHVAWELNRSIPEIPSPLLDKKRLYMVRNGGILASVNATDGKLIYDQRLNGSGQYSASPVIAGGHLYLVSNRGLVSVVKAGDSFELVHQFDLGEPAFVTPAFDPATIYIRTQTNLWGFRTGG